MSWLPRLSSYGTAIAEREFEAEGRELQLIWGPWVFQITLARIDRRFDGIDWDNADAR